VGEGSVREIYNRLPLWTKAAGITGLNLSGGMLLGLVSGIAISQVPLHLPRIDENLIAAIAAISVFYLAGRRWTAQMLRLTKFEPNKRIVRAGGLSFAGSIIAAGLSLAGLEGLFVQLRLGPSMPIHMLFGGLFVPATFVVVAVVSAILGAAIRNARTGLSLALRSAPVAALAFLLVWLGMDRIGYRVGAPGAEERATMVTVMMLGSLGASLAGGAALGTALVRVPKSETPDEVEFRQHELGYSDG
jgi:hypothetical protein